MASRKRRSNETGLSKSIREARDASGVWNIRVNSGEIHRQGVHMILAPKGTPDIWTEFGWIEVKDLAKLSPEQVLWHAKAKSRGINSAVVHSVSDALKVVSDWKQQSKGAA